MIGYTPTTTLLGSNSMALIPIEYNSKNCNHIKSTEMASKVNIFHTSENSIGENVPKVKDARIK